MAASSPGTQAPGRWRNPVLEMISLRSTALLLAVLAPLLYARITSPSELGSYYLASAYLALLAVPAEFGMGEYVTRQAAYHGRNQIGAWVDRGLRTVLATGSVLFATTFFVAAFQPSSVSIALLTGASLLLINPACRVLQAGLRAQERPLYSQFHQQITGPVAMLALLALYLLVDRRATSAELMAGMVVAGVLPLVLYARRTSVNDLASSTADANLPRALKGALPFAALGALGIANSRLDILILSHFVSSGELAGYALASRVGEVLAMPLTASAFVLAPRIASAASAGSLPHLQGSITLFSRVAALATAPIAAACIIAPGFILENAFGRDYVDASQALRILASAQFFNAITGPAGMLLIMSGHARDTIAALAISALICGSLTLIFSPLYGIDGAAIATGTAIVSWNLILWRRVWRRLSIAPSALGI